MGSCNYYLKAKFASPADAEQAGKAFAEFIKESGKAYDYWQDNRNSRPSKFWAGFARQFPLTHKFLEGTKQKTRDCNNGLSGTISFTNGAKSCNNVEIIGNQVRYHEEVWHCASWSQLCKWLESEFGALAAVWASEEHGASGDDPFASLEFEDDLAEKARKKLFRDMAIRSMVAA